MSTQNRVAESGRAGARAGEWALSRASGGHGRRLTTRHACKTRNGKTGGGGRRAYERGGTDGRGRTNGRQARLKLRRRRRPNQPINRFATSPPPFIRCTAGYSRIEFVEAEAYITDVSDTSLCIPTSSLGTLFCSRAENPLWLISDICLQETKWAFVRPSTPSCSRICLHELRFWKLGWDINVSTNSLFHSRF